MSIYCQHYTPILSNQAAFIELTIWDKRLQPINNATVAYKES